MVHINKMLCNKHKIILVSLLHGRRCYFDSEISRKFVYTLEAPCLFLTAYV